MPLQINFEFLLHRSFVANSVPPLFDSPVYLAQAQNMSHLGTSPPSGGQQSQQTQLLSKLDLQYYEIVED